MSLAIARRSISIYLDRINQDSDSVNVKLFGGEPLLKFGLISSIVRVWGAGQNKKSIIYSVTTNGSLLKKKHVNFFNGQKNVDVWISFYFRKLNDFKKFHELLPDAGVNITIAPSSVNFFFSAFKTLVESGFNRFNFLPAYFLIWPQDKLLILFNEFEKILSFLDKRKREGIFLDIKNTSTFSPTPLFNNGMIVDCNGEVFFNNLFLTKTFYFLRKDLQVGNVFEHEKIQWNKFFDFNKLIEMHTAPMILFSTLSVDKILTHFVRRLIEQRGVL
jgi:hypothetical protein